MQSKIIVMAEARVLIEIEGGIWVNGRHNRAAGFNADLEPSRLAGGEMDSAQRNPQGLQSVRRNAGQKYLAAGLSGWRVFRFGPDQITLENVERLAEQVRDEIRRFSTQSLWLKIIKSLIMIR